MHKKILAPLDGSEGAEMALPYAAGLSSKLNMPAQHATTSTRSPRTQAGASSYLARLRPFSSMVRQLSPSPIMLPNTTSTSS